MKAIFIALAVSLFAVTIPCHAETPQKIPIEKPAAPITKKINLNKADVLTLTGSFKGIGKKRAEAIIAYRDSHHGFKSIEEFAEVKGFGQRFVEKNREQLKELFVIN